MIMSMPAKDGWPSICCGRKQVANFLLKVWSANPLFHFRGNPVGVLLQGLCCVLLVDGSKRSSSVEHSSRMIRI